MQYHEHRLKEVFLFFLAVHLLLPLLFQLVYLRHLDYSEAVESLSSS